MEFIFAIPMVIGRVLSRLFPKWFTRHVDADSDLGQLVSFLLGAAVFAGFLAAAVMLTGPHSS